MMRKSSCSQRLSRATLVLAHRLLIFASLSFGFYSITDSADESQKHPTNFLAVSIDFLYPLTYIATCVYISGSADFSAVLSRLGSSSSSAAAERACTCFMLLSYLCCCVFSVWQKLSWWGVQSDERRTDPNQQILLIIFAVTFSLRLLCVCVHTAIVIAVCYDHVLVVAEFVRRCVADGLVDAAAEQTLLRRHMALQQEVSPMHSRSLAPSRGICSKPCARCAHPASHHARQPAQFAP
jgi:hypothetical protein